MTRSNRVPLLPFWVCSAAVHLAAASLAAWMAGPASSPPIPSSHPESVQAIVAFTVIDPAAGRQGAEADPLRSGPPAAIPHAHGAVLADVAHSPAGRAPIDRVAAPDGRPRHADRRATRDGILRPAGTSVRVIAPPSAAAPAAPADFPVAGPASPSTAPVPVSDATRAGEGGLPSPGAGADLRLGLGPRDSPTWVSLGSGDPRYADYLGAIAALLEPEWRDAFPRERALYMQQGEIVIEWTVHPGGVLRGPWVVRPSGVAPFDRNVLEGFRRASARFPPPPATIALPLRIRAPYDFRNPMFE